MFVPPAAEEVVVVAKAKKNHGRTPSPKPQTVSPRRKKPAEATEPFVFGCDVAIFSEAELQALQRHGARFEALATGQAHPVTPEEKRFIRVHQEKEKPHTLAEKAWLRLKARREYEREQKEKPPPAPPEDYGMIEFDADRCWW
ncbi:MAG: DUF413 domain-containing protein [Gemmataceae bacterium]|nr:DUF413 domain-containing protein [Gemmata sp.]MDW8197292.1 DUF413 domain-containing protein [Gemmataceae bacterium]